MDKELLSSPSLSEKDQAVIWHPFTQMQTAALPIPIVRGEGSYLYTEAGRSYLDAISSWWVNLHGHSHPYIAEQIAEQAKTLEHVIFADFTHDPAVELATKLLPLLPGKMSKLFYSDNGSTAVEVALKMALQYWHNKGQAKKRIICFKNSYHGDTFGAMSIAGKNEFNKPFWSHLFDVVLLEPPLPGKEELSLSQLRAALAEEPTACFIFEPLVMGVGGMVIYPPEGLAALLRLCKERGVLAIADEVMTGFGRTGTLFACEQIQEKPDIICLSKGITGGFLPLGATACTEEIFAAFLHEEKRYAFLHGHSYTANPLATRAGVASLSLLLEEGCTLQREMIAASHKAFIEIVQSSPKLVRAESLGTILALEYKADDASYFASIRDRLYLYFLERGVLLRPLGNVLYILPPYCIKQEELRFIYAQITHTLEGEL